MPKPPKCEGCPLYAAEGPVWSEGPKTARLVILGQNPGPNEIKENRPFVGTSGNILNRTLGKVGISRATSYVTNAVKCYVKPGQKVPPGAVSHCRKAFLEPEFEELKPAVVLTLGQEAFDSLCSPKHVSIVHVRQAAKKDPSYWLVGAPYHHPHGFVVVPAVHPAFVARTGFALQPKFENQLAKAKWILDEGAPSHNDLTFNYNPTAKEVLEYVELCRIKSDIGIDIETSEKIEEDELDLDAPTPINLVGLAASDRDCMGVSPDQFELLLPLFTGNSVFKPRAWAYNAGFDFYHLENLFGPCGGVRQADAMLAFHLLWSDERSKDLGTAMAMYTRWGYHKNLEKRDPIIYNALDTCGGLEAGMNMYREMEAMPVPMTTLFWNMCDTVPEIKPWQTLGAPYDQNLSDQYELMIGRALTGLTQFWNSKFPLVDWASPKQLCGLFTSLGFPPPMKLRKKSDGTTHKTPSVDEEALEGFAKKGSAVAKLLLQMRSFKKSDEFVNVAVRGRLRTRCKLHGQAGGRFQCVDKNVQQIPEVLLATKTSPGISPRNAVLPEHEDDAVIAADFSQIEFWLYAYYSKCQKLIDVKNKGEYLYGDFYESIWNEPFFLPNQPRYKQFRDDQNTPPWKLLVAKSWPLGFIYGRGVPGVEGLPIPAFRAKQIRTDFHNAYPEIGRYHSDLMFEATKKGFLQTAFGRMRRFPNPTGQRNQLLAFPGQSTAVDLLDTKVILGAGRAIAREFGPRSRLYFTVHDSGIFNIQGARRDPKLGAQAVEWVKSWMESPTPELEGYVIPAEVKIGPSWGQVMGVDKYVKIASSAT